MQQADIPSVEPEDAIMAGSAEVAEISDWVRACFAGERPEGPGPRLDIELRQQDHNVLRYGQSCMETPLRIGSESFERGLGTHANSVIAVALPEGARAFSAQVGVDNNYDTAGARGTVRFIVEVDGVELFRTEVLRGGDAPVPLRVNLPEGAREMVLKVDATEDGAAYDQADWADARLEMAGGEALFLDENQLDPFLRLAGPPFSFTYGGIPSAELLGRWDRFSTSRELEDRTEHSVTWTDPETGLAVTAVAAAFKRYPAAEWVLSFENRGEADTPLIEGIQAMDLQVRTGNSKRAAVVSGLRGDVCGAESFVPFAQAMNIGEALSQTPEGGRPSNGAFPFWDLSYGDEGLAVALGWSGQWSATFDRTAPGPMRLRGGMELTRLSLRPGEGIRSPRVLVMSWRGDRIDALNRWRRLLLFHYVPRVDGLPIRLPFALQCFDRYSWTRPEWATEKGQIAAAETAASLGFDAHWLDAAWFPGGFPNGVGNWTPKPEEFPAGLKPIGDACRRLGLSFVLWYEPERVAPGSVIATEHPAFVHGGEQGGLFRLDDPEARRWLTELLSSQIEEFGIGIYRNDFNLDPLPYWRANDEPGREGMTEIRYVEGHYAMWDELLARHPGLRIDNCASGGRRIDLETIMRSMPLWRSDTSCSPGHPDWNQSQSAGLCQYLPLHTACGWTPDPYDFRSSATGGAIAQWDYMAPDFPADLARETLAEARANAPYWYGDFTPLALANTDPDHWGAYQLHRADLDAGIVLAFRRPSSSYLSLQARLRGLDPEGVYRLELIDDQREVTHQEATGADLMAGYELRIAAPGSSLLIRYARVDAE